MKGVPSDLHLPAEARQPFAELLSLVKQGSEPNHEELAQHVGMLRAASAEHEFLDLALLETLSEGHAELLDATERLRGEPRAVALAAVAYFLLTDDGDSDLESVVGLEDDAQVFTAVVRYLGLPIKPVSLS